MASTSTSSLAGFELGRLISRDRSHVMMSAIHREDQRAVWIRFTDARGAGQEAFAELRHEAELTAGLLSGAILKPIEIHETSRGPVLVYEPFPGARLSENGIDREPGGGGFFALAQAVTSAVAELHGQRVIHKRLSPEAVFYDPHAKRAKLTQLGRAARIQGKTRELAALEQEVSGFAYLAPEQTGRLNWAVGFGSDLYALGIIFYELLTGHLPFHAADPLEWVHCHLARTPVPPAEIDPGIPSAVSAVIVKLLAKNPADRYLSASGLLADLVRAEAALIEERNGAPFIPGKDDHSEQFQLPERLYGRTREFAQLSEALERARAGSAGLIAITGPPGSGKSSLVYEWCGTEWSSAITRGTALFAAGKYERFQRDQPYFGLRQAIAGLCRVLECDTEERRELWKNRLNSALGSVGHVMTENFPALLSIVGDQPPVPDLPPAEARNRFNEAFRKLISALADPANPLVIFLDDAQWADSGSLGLIESLITAPEHGGLLLILGYRDQDAADLEAIDRALADFRNHGLAWAPISARPLTIDDVSAMLADTMGGPAERFGPLSHIVCEKTGGNPFFVRQFLLQLSEEDLIFYENGWRWDETAIRQSKVTDNVVAFVAERIGRLPEPWRKLLEMGSCFGSRVRETLLPALLDQSGADVSRALEGALAAGALLRRGGEYTFVHDRVREAAYSLIPPAALPALHLSIARTLLAQPEDGIAADLLDIVHHFGLAKPVVPDALRLEIRQLNLRAARRARNAAAYGPALDYARAACPPLDDPLWDPHYTSCADAALVLSECLFFNQLQSEFESFNAALFRRLHSEEHLAALHRGKILACSAGSRHREALTAAHDALDYLGASLPPDGDATFAALGQEIASINYLIAGRKIEDLRGIPPLADPRVEATIGILISITPDTVMLGLGALYAFVVARAVRLSLEHGFSGLVPVVFANYSVVVHQTTGDVHTAYEWARLATALDHASGGKWYAPVNFIPAWLVAGWKLEVRSQIHLLELTSRIGLEHGDILFGCFSAAAAIVFISWSGSPLQDVVRVAKEYRAIIRGRVYSADYHCVIEQQFSRALMGLTQGRTSLAGAEVSQTELDAVRKTGSAHQIGYYFVTQLRLAYLFGETEEAERWAAEVAPWVPGLAGLLIHADYAFYHSLAMLAGEDNSKLPAVRDHALRLKSWAIDCPANFLPYSLMVEGELARVEGRIGEACSLLNQAVTAAETSSLIHHAALGCELLVSLYLERGDSVAARAWLHEAMARYQTWGAVAKVAELTERYPELRSGEAPRAPVAGDSLQPQSLDVLTLMKSSQAISAEIVMDRLLDRMMRTIIENACAEWGALILNEAATSESESLVLKAISRGNEHDEIQLSNQPIDQSNAVPHTILRHVASTREALVLADARRAREFAADPVIRATQPRSVLCAPILHKGALSGLIYLENNLATGAFTPERLEVLHLLSSQIAVSLENARYHERTIEWERLQHDLEAARAIQVSLLPRETPDVLPYLLAVRSAACYEVGGDYIDVLPQPNGDWMMVVADVAGKGLASAMIAASFRSAFRAIAGTAIALPELAGRLGHLHWSEGDEARRRYVTAVFLRLNRDSHTLEIVNAGHNPVFVVHRDGTSRRFAASAPPLGIMSGIRYLSESVPFPAGTRLLAYTDGLTEVFRDDEEFGEDRLLSVFARAQFESAPAVLDEIWRELNNFASDPRQRDDMTALALCRVEE